MPRDTIRMVLGDVGPDFWLSDAHIDAVLMQHAGNIAATQLTLAHALVQQFANQPQKMSADGVSVDYGARMTAWDNLIARLHAAQPTTPPRVQSATGLLSAGSMTIVR